MPTEAERARAQGGRRRGRKSKARNRNAPEPELIAARRPNGIVVPVRRSLVAASAAPKRERPQASASEPPPEVLSTDRRSEPPPKRQARIVLAPKHESDDRAKERAQLLDRVMRSEGRGAISRAARDYEAAGFEFPEEQAVQLQLLEHFDETCARRALEALAVLVQKQPPLKWPVFEQRLRRIEEYAEEAATREAAAGLRRTLRA